MSYYVFRDEQTGHIGVAPIEGPCALIDPKRAPHAALEILRAAGYENPSIPELQVVSAMAFLQKFIDGQDKRPRILSMGGNWISIHIEDTRGIPNYDTSETCQIGDVRMFDV